MKLKIESLILLSVVIFAVFVRGCSCGRFSKPRILKPVHATITNYLVDGADLHIHCRSKDNDLGEQTLANNAQFSWTFKVNVMFSTLFWCDMWYNDVNGIQVTGKFDIYKAQRDWDRCYNECQFFVRKDCIAGYINGGVECLYAWPQ
ncbi:hypothetical protein MKW94_010571 [Papaver nudicaule]|uniref:S-protein homolog n=1 Tax=Papaver nudicaule TaxID=74823 RepID=A0AA41RN76_PAPNU|nr:hypothetical protein [Papaver nudicaule]